LKSRLLQVPDFKVFYFHLPQHFTLTALLSPHKKETETRLSH
jgi:hypothetical protein